MDGAHLKITPDFDAHANVVLDAIRSVQGNECSPRLREIQSLRLLPSEIEPKESSSDALWLHNLTEPEEPAVTKLSPTQTIFETGAPPLEPVDVSDITFIRLRSHNFVIPSDPPDDKISGAPCEACGPNDNPPRISLIQLTGPLCAA